MSTTGTLTSSFLEVFDVLMFLALFELSLLGVVSFCKRSDTFCIDFAVLSFCSLLFVSVTSMGTISFLSRSKVNFSPDLGSKSYI